MKICTMCGCKILKSMLPFQVIMEPTVKVDVCGRCFMLTRIYDHLQNKEIAYVNARGPELQVTN